ncbi:MJ0042 family finger-like domain protein [Brevundimonas diminuta 470-4]|nr:MJ0042 family finger-like domain protein [Brevundimonas diminuta 470-4]
MILTCPACATSYFVPDEAIGPNGRRVRCKTCGHDWRASLEDAPLELEPATEGLSPAADPASETLPESLAETPAPELPRAFRARAERKRRTRQAAAAGAAWAAAAAVVLGLITGGVLFREEIVRKFPATAGAYGALGLNVNIVGLEFEAQRARVAPRDPGRIVVSGAVRNIRETEVSSPPIRVILQDERGVEIASRVVRPDWPPILPGKVEGFATVIADPQGKAAGMTTKFILEPARKAPPRPADKKARPEPAAREDGGLRRLGALDLGPTPAPLDTDVADGVSARHG